jgi:hypothetical protein
MRVIYLFVRFWQLENQLQAARLAISVNFLLLQLAIAALHRVQVCMVRVRYGLQHVRVHQLVYVPYVLS